jgi:hypothetical protein
MERREMVFEESPERGFFHGWHEFVVFKSKGIP